MRIAIAGKGGVGKTTVAALLARTLSQGGRQVTAVDADPDANLAAALGVDEVQRRAIVPLAQMLDLVEQRTGVRPGSGSGSMFRLNPKVDDLHDRFGVGGADGVTVLVLGSIRGPASGCFCPESALLKHLLRHLCLQDGQALVLDMEAGIEHLGRSTVERVDALMVVVEPSLASVHTAATIHTLATGLGVSRIEAVINKARNDVQIARVREELERCDIPVAAVVPFDDSAFTWDLSGQLPDLDSEGPLVRAIGAFAKDLEATVG